MLFQSSVVLPALLLGEFGLGGVQFGPRKAWVMLVFSKMALSCRFVGSCCLSQAGQPLL